MRRFAIRFALALGCGAPSLACTVSHVHDADGVKRFGALADAPPSTLTELDVERFAGRWYVVRSNVEFWTKEHRTDPSVLFEPMHNAGDTPGLVKLGDRIEFRERGRPRDHVGIDLQDPTRAGHFQWRGDGALYAMVVQWYVVHVEPDYRWAILYVPKRNLGPGAGVEIIARGPALAPDDDERALAIIAGDPFLRARSRGLFAPHHDTPQ